MWQCWEGGKGEMGWGCFFFWGEGSLAGYKRIIFSNGWAGWGSKCQGAPSKNWGMEF